MICAKVRLGIRAAHFRAAVFVSALFLFASTAALSQSAQQYVYANVPGTPPATSTLAAYAKNGQTGGLSAVPNAPFNDRLEGGRLAVDALGRFLFVLNRTTNGISMYQIDSSTGALTEVPNSPFSSGKTVNLNQAPSTPISLSTEKSGKYLYVGYTSGNFTNSSAITPFNIDATNLALTLTDQLSFDVPFNPVQMFSDPRGLFLYVVNGLNPFTGVLNEGATVYSIVATDGSLALNGPAGSGSEGRVMASDPQGRFFFNGSGQFSGSIFWGAISPLDGTSNPNSQFLDLGQNNFPLAMVIDNSGRFLYVQQSAGLVIYSIDQTTGQPTPITAPLASPTFQLGNVVADPSGAFLYAGSSAGVRAYQVSPQDGSLTEVTGSPFSSGGTASNVAISGTSIQAIGGPSVAFTPSSLNFGSVTGGQSVVLVLHLVNNGDQSLAINLAATSITGTNAGDFSQSTTCLAVLAPNANCSFAVTFTPSTSGNESALLAIFDNASGSPQGIPLAGVGMAPAPSITFVPSSLTFSPISQGSAEGPQTIQITNIGSAALHISSVALGGSNPQDFSQTSNCTTAPIAVNGNCAINVSFAPLATGARSASITVTDDAPGSPQTLFVQGTGAIPFQLSAAPQSSTSASITAGQTAQYGLQLNPGVGFTGNVSVSCTGAPVGAKCALSVGMLTVTSSNPIPFNVTVSTTGSSTGQLPPIPISRIGWRTSPLPFAAALLLFVMWIMQRETRVRARRVAAYASLLFFVLVIAEASGCGGGSTATTVITPPPPPPPPQITPKGNYQIIVSATANNVPAQSITLTLTVN